ncbi:MAG: potassium transporter TrkH [Pseudobutyrivibrio sp.]|nr:potassium transporter TrkH [Pseudobutyrivibrio sp.]
MKLKRVSSMRLIPISFLVAIFAGAIMLTLPISSADGTWTDFITALFTATTSVCVTGLTVVDTVSYWSSFGHVIILCLIQVGGFGIITVISMIMLLTQKKFSLGDRKMLQDSLNLQTDTGILKMLIKIFRGTLTVELLGAALYSIEFIPRFGIGKGIWVSVFTSISAFCNAGIDIIGTNSLGDFASNPLVLFVTMFLIVLGGLGYVVWFDLSANIRKGFERRFNPVQIFKRFGEHTKLVLTVTFSLIVIGWAVFFIAEFNNPATIGNMSLVDKVINSLFESITLRTAGFATFSQHAMTDFSCVICYVLMFVGGSPVGTAGGIKTVTFFLALMGIISYIRSDDAHVLFHRRVSDEALRKASVIVYVSAFTIIVLTLIIIATNPVNMEDALFEVISASATVGLTRDFTTTLNTVGRIIIIIAMYLGRIGPISMAIFFAGRPKKEKKCNYLEGKFFVG